MDNKTLSTYINDIVSEHKAMVECFEQKGIETILAIVEAIIRTLEKNGTVYICGNGGSAADAQHIAGELVGRFKRERKALRAVSLTTDTSIITSIANDYNYNSVFTRQVEALITERDILWALSTSGNSKNIVEAAQLAKEKGAFVIGFTGRAETSLGRIADICFCAESTSTARSQEIHQIAYHIICDLVERNFC